MTRTEKAGEGAESFDLVDEPWIPVWRGSGVEVNSLRTVLLEAEQIGWLACEYVLQTAGVLRLLEALTYRITGLDRERVATRWAAKRNDILASGLFDPDLVNTYLDTWVHRFDLFDPDRPFGQDARLRDEGVKLSQIGKLVFGVPAGNNPAWFERVDVALESGDAAQWLLAALCHASGGRTSSRQSDATSVAAIARNRVSVHLRGPNLLVSLLANLTCPTSDVERLPWEAGLPPVDSGATQVAQVDAVNTTLGRWRHAFLLERATGDRVTGVRATWLHRKVEEVDDPHLIYHHRRGPRETYERLARSAAPSYQLWRDVLALREDPLLTENGEESGVAVVGSAADLPDAVIDTVGVFAVAHHADKSSDLQAWESAAPRGVLDWLLHDEACCDRAERLLARVEVLEDVLRAALNHLRKEAGRSSGRNFDSWRESALAAFLAEAEQRFWTAVDDADADPRLASLALTMFDDAVEALSEVPQYSYHVQRARKKILSAGWPAKPHSKTQTKGAD